MVVSVIGLLFYFLMLGRWSKFFFFLLPELKSLHIWTPSVRVGDGLCIGHGWSSVINAYSIGENCLVGQNLTIGSRNLKEPTLGNDVYVWAHAIVLGDITIGSRTDIGAGAIVAKPVPKGCVVVPESSLIIRQKDERVRIKM